MVTDNDGRTRATARHDETPVPFHPHRPPSVRCRHDSTSGELTGCEDVVYNPVDWRHATTAELEGLRVIARFDNGTVVDGTIVTAPGGAIGVYVGVMVPIIEKASSGLFRQADHVSALQVLDCRKEGKFYAG